MSARIQPVGIKKIGSRRLEMTWADGHTSLYQAGYLRERCQCAQCVDEWTGQKYVAPGSVSPALEMVGVEIVGQYALTFTWSDGHRTGIYSFQYLRQLCPCEQCQRTEGRR
jgi:DUF971 family protein